MKNQINTKELKEDVLREYFDILDNEHATIDRYDSINENIKDSEFCLMCNEIRFDVNVYDNICKDCINKEMARN